MSSRLQKRVNDPMLQLLRNLQTLRRTGDRLHWVLPIVQTNGSEYNCLWKQI